jgi:hypothetical protein
MKLMNDPTLSAVICELAANPNELTGLTEPEDGLPAPCKTFTPEAGVRYGKPKTGEVGRYGDDAEFA